jgi:hypothetical protein
VPLETRWATGQTWKQTLPASSATKEGNKEMTFSYHATKSGHYKIIVFYRQEEKRNVYLTVNQADAALTVYPSSKDQTNQIPLFATLFEGDNHLCFSSDSALPQIEKIEVMYLGDVPDALEAEYGITTGQAAISKDEDASGKQYVRFIGNGSNNILTLKYDAPNAGKYDVSVVYFTSQNRQMYVRVNSGSKTMETYLSTGGWEASTAQTKTMTVTMKAGTNTIVLGNDTNWAPYVDKLVIVPHVEPSSVGNIRAEQTIDNDAWYLLNGMNMKQPLTSGIYIHKQKKYLVMK